MTEPIVIPIEPCPKPRMTQRDKWKKRPSVVRYRKFCDQWKAHCAWPGYWPKAALQPGWGLLFIVPMPNSWSKKKRAFHDGTWHEQKPDLDNFIKAVLDASFEDDSGHYALGPTGKVWGNTGAIVLIPCAPLNPLDIVSRSSVVHS